MSHIDIIDPAIECPDCDDGYVLVEVELAATLHLSSPPMHLVACRTCGGTHRKPCYDCGEPASVAVDGVPLCEGCEEERRESEATDETTHLTLDIHPYERPIRPPLPPAA